MILMESSEDILSLRAAVGIAKTRQDVFFREMGIAGLHEAQIGNGAHLEVALQLLDACAVEACHVGDKRAEGDYRCRDQPGNRLPIAGGLDIALAQVDQMAARLRFACPPQIFHGHPQRRQKIRSGNQTACSDDFIQFERKRVQRRFEFMRADAPLLERVGYFLVVLIPTTVLAFYTIVKSKRLSDFLEALSDERLPAKAKFNSLLDVWRKAPKTHA